MCSNLGSGSANAAIAATWESRCTAFATNQIKRVATKWDILTTAQDAINWLHTKTFHGQTTSVDYVPSAVGNAYRIFLPSQNDTEFESIGWLTSNSYLYTTELANLNSSLNSGNPFKTLWSALLLEQFAKHPLDAHKMTQVIFGLLGQDLFGYAP